MVFGGEAFESEGFQSDIIYIIEGNYFQQGTAESLDSQLKAIKLEEQRLVERFNAKYFKEVFSLEKTVEDLIKKFKK
jgi:hypothetical protein